MRRLVRETRLDPANFILPLFVYLEEALKQQARPTFAHADFAVISSHIDGHLIIDRGLHLAGNEAIPDQSV